MIKIDKGYFRLDKNQYKSSRAKHRPAALYWLPHQILKPHRFHDFKRLHLVFVRYFYNNHLCNAG